MKPYMRVFLTLFIIGLFLGLTKVLREIRGKNSGDMILNFLKWFVSAIKSPCLPIGIGLPITEKPSHTTWHTDRVPRRFGW